MVLSSVRGTSLRSACAMMNPSTRRCQPKWWASVSAQAPLARKRHQSWPITWFSGLLITGPSPPTWWAKWTILPPDDVPGPLHWHRRHVGLAPPQSRPHSTRASTEWCLEMPVKCDCWDDTPHGLPFSLSTCAGFEVFVLSCVRMEMLMWWV